MARILMLTLVYGPDTASTATLMTDIATGLASAGHDVTVLTSIPHYNPPPAIRKLPAHRPPWYRPITSSHEQGVLVWRVYMPQKGRRVWTRLFDYALFQLQTTIAAVLYARNQDIVFVTSPPITLGLSGVLLARLFGARFVYNVQELWPDAPVRMGMVRNRFAKKVINGLERFVYRHSDAVASIARGFASRLVERGVVPERLHFIPNFVDLDRLQPRSKTNAFAVEHGLHDKFVVLYAGNIGLTQGLEILVQTARALQDAQPAEVVIVGNGVALPELARLARAADLSNLRLLPFQPAERVPDVYATADVCVVPLKKGFAYDTVPSKVYSVMAAGRPVVACAEPDSETALLLSEADAGLTVAPESVDELTRAIRTLQTDPERRRRLGDQGRRWIAEHCSRDLVITAYDRMFRNLTEASPGS